jgi:hypothetical protein
MKKNLISLAVATTVASGAAFAGQHVSPDGTGQVLLFPMYNADNGNATNVHIVNTTANVKAVKVRFLEYKNSDEVLDFNVYLSKNDHFAFGVIKDPNGTGAAVITTDNSCTVPALGSANGAFTGTATTNADGSITRIQPFVNYQYANSFDVDSTIERTLTGHIEVIEMGEIQNVGALPAAAATQYATFATHGATGVPSNCAGLDKAWASGAWATPATQNNNANGVFAPTGGLYGLAYHINVDAAAAFGFEPTAIDQWATASQHTNPGSLAPSIINGQPVANIYTGLAASDGFKRVTYANGQDAVNSLLMTGSLSNDVMINPAIGGQTDWVVSFPTKRQSVDKALAAQVIPPFTDNWRGSYTSGTVKKEDPACEPVSINQWDREEAFTANTNSFSPTPAVATTSICNETAIVAMGAAGTASALSASTGVTNLGFPYTEGWQSFSFTNAAQRLPMPGGANVDGQGVRIAQQGLPAIGFAAYKVNNGAMSYGNAAEHKTNATFSGVIQNDNE